MLKQILVCDLCQKHNGQTTFSFPFVGIGDELGGFDYSFCDSCLKKQSAFNLLIHCFDYMKKEQQKAWEENQKKYSGKQSAKKLK